MTLVAKFCNEGHFIRLRFWGVFVIFYFVGA